MSYRIETMHNHQCVHSSVWPRLSNAYTITRIMTFVYNLSLDVDIVIAPSHYAARHWSVTNYFKRIVVVSKYLHASATGCYFEFLVGI